MSGQIAAALIGFTVLQIFVISTLVAWGAPSLLHYAGIAALIAGAIPAARGLERRWEALDEGGLSHQRLAARFRHDQVRLWAAALLLPLLWLPAGAAVTALFG